MMARLSNTSTPIIAQQKLSTLIAYIHWELTNDTVS